MPSVDERIVRMEFDNASFERKLGTTLTSLDKLEKSLKFEGAAKGLQNVSQTAGKMNFGGLSNAVTGIKDKFSAMSVIGVTALATIASKAVSAGGRIVKSLALDNIIAGFKEYETNIGSIQTILANTKAQGTNLEDVNSALDQLNEYSDKTIYNFGQMAKNIGTFTAAGVDLDTSVSSIKGIANLAAISGSSSEQASTAMYQLSQAISSGTLKLQDWNSVTNAGMGGRVFQEALFESGKALGQIKDVPIDQTFKEWTDAGNSFRGSLQDGWLTSDVLTTTLQGFTGEMTEAQLVAKGFSEEAAKNMVEMGKTGVDAATQVRTLTGLIDTTKEALASGWSRSFRTIFGDFNEATKLFTKISGAVSDMVGKSADARNKVLEGWKDLGGRDLLIRSLGKTVKNLGKILKPIKEAFRDIFPPMTAKRLFNLTKKFNEFAKALRPSRDTVDKLRRIFKGFFGILEIGWVALKGTVKFIKSLFTSLTGAGSGNFLEFIAKIGDFFTDLNKKLVAGKGIKRFFRELRGTIRDIVPFIGEIKDKIIEFFESFKKLPKFDIKQIIKNPLPFIQKIKDNFVGIFEGLKVPQALTDGLDTIKDKLGDIFGGIDIKAPEGLTKAFGRVGQRFETLKGIFSKVAEIWKPFKKGFDKVVDVLDNAWDAITGWFSDLKDKLKEVLGPGDFDAVKDAINIGLLGGIIVTIRKFMKKGIKFDIGEGMLEKIGKSFEELTGVMKAMQTDIKAGALLKIAGAIAILTASVLVLSLIDSAALTKALTAMAVGFGQLMGAFAIITKMSAGPKGAVSFTTLALGMIALAGAVTILAIAAKLLGGMSWEEISKGLAGVTGMLMSLAIAVKIMGGATKMISIGVGLMAVATAMVILTGAVKLMSMLSWEEIIKGLSAVTIGIALIAAALRLMPESVARQGLQLTLLAFALNVIAAAVSDFGQMDWKTIAQGLVTIAATLVIIAGAMNLMPANMPLIGVGLLLVSGAIVVLGKALQVIAEMSWGELAKGLVGIAGALLILGVAASAMQSSIGGFIAMTIGAGALLLVAEVVKQFAKISWGDLLHGLLGIAAILATLAISAMLIQPALPAMLGLGAALIVIGAGFALFGVGANLVAKAFETLAKVAPEGAKNLGAALKEIGKALPAFFAGLGEGLLELTEVFIKAAPAIAKGLVVLLGHILDGLDTLIPKAIKLLGKVLDAMFDFLIDKVPKFAMMGVRILLGLLRGIRDNIGEVVEVVAEIITEFLDALTEKVPEVAESVAEFFRTVMSTAILVLNPATLMFGVGVDVIQGFLDGLDDMFGDVIDWFLDFMGDILDSILDFFGIKSPSTKFFDIGVDLLTGLINGIKNGAVAVFNWFKELPGKMIRWVGNVVKSLFQKGKDFITGLFNGIKKRVIAVAVWFGQLEIKVVKWVGNVIKTLFQKGIDLIKGLWDGIWERIQAVKTWFVNLGTTVLKWIGNLLTTLKNKGINLIKGFWDGIWERVQAVKTFFQDLPSKIVTWVGETIETLLQLGKDLIEGLKNGVVWIWEKADGLRQWFYGLPGKIKDAIVAVIGRPIDFLVTMGEDIIKGLWNGMINLFEEVKGWFGRIWDWIPGWAKKVLGLDSPSRVMREIGENTIKGFVIAFENDRTTDRAAKEYMTNATNNFKNAARRISDELGSITEFSPTIRPVLDLTSVQSDAKKINGYIQDTQKLMPVLSYKQAQLIASNTRPMAEEATTNAMPTEIRFEQTINAPKQLSTNDIYKQTRNQITLAKEELSIL